ncbi:MAG: polysaccharide biosynthesis/export family protein [Sphingomonadaceae bacterium]
MNLNVPRLRYLPAIALLALLTGGCAGPNFVPEKATAVETRQQLPPPMIADIYNVSRETRVGPGDSVLIEVLDVPELKRELKVDGSGKFVFPLVGEIDALGLTQRELAQRLHARLSTHYLQDPQVSVNITESVSERMTIIGGVQAPGQYPVIGDASLTDAISYARGLTDAARADEIIIFRTVDGNRLAARFDLAAINGGRAEDPLVYPSDRIVVGTDSNRSLLRDLAPLTPLLGIFYQIF